MEKRREPTADVDLPDAQRYATPLERVIAQRPHPEYLHGLTCEFDEWLDVTWTATAIERHVIQDGDLSFAVGFELARDEDRIRYVATASYIFTGTFTVILDIRCGPAREDDEGTCELGPVMRAYDTEFYEHGADLLDLRDAGARLSWESAQWLYEVGRAELDEIHAEGKAIAARPRQIRLRLFHRPFTPSKKVPGRFHDGPPNDELEWPPAFAFVGGTRPLTDTLRAADRAMLASVVGGLTHHPVPEIDRLLRDPDPSSGDVLRDLLLERGQPVEPLLRDRVNGIGLPTLPLIDTDTIDDELAALWNQVVSLDRMLDTSTCEIRDLPRTPLDDA